MTSIPANSRTPKSAKGCFILGRIPSGCVILFVIGLTVVCFLNPGVALGAVDDLFRNYFVKVTLPTFIQPEIEKIPGVVVTYVSDGGYEDLVYLTLTVNNSWTMSLHISSNTNFMRNGQFRVEAVGDCILFDEQFTDLAEAIEHYEHSSAYQQCKNKATPFIPINKR